MKLNDLQEIIEDRIYLTKVHYVRKHNSVEEIKAAFKEIQALYLILKGLCDDYKVEEYFPYNEETQYHDIAYVSFNRKLEGRVEVDDYGQQMVLVLNINGKEEEYGLGTYNFYWRDDCCDIIDDIILNDKYKDIFAAEGEVQHE